jgi:hypothetical protein
LLTKANVAALFGSDLLPNRNRGTSPSLTAVGLYVATPGLRYLQAARARIVQARSVRPRHTDPSI